MKKYNRLHWVHSAVSTISILTGLLLYNQSFRGILADFRIYLKDIHMVSGCIFTTTVIAYLCYFTVSRDRYMGKRDMKPMVLVLIILAIGITLTGIQLLLPTNAQVVIGLSSLYWHKVLAVPISIAVVYHVMKRLPLLTCVIEGQEKLEFEDEGFKLNRRIFVRWVAAVTVLFGGGVLVKWFLERMNDSEQKKTAKRFKNCNKMESQPVPSLGSIPPIGGGYKGEFEVFTVTKIPCANSNSWQFRMFGLVDNPIALSWEKLLEIPRKVQISDFYCITGWTVNHVTYEGITLSKLLALGGVKPNARFVKFYSDDGIYTSALSLEQAKLDDVMIAVLMDGQPIPSDLGGPARLIVPQMYAYKGVKWVNAVEVISEAHVGFWESRGYENDAWVKRSNL